MKQKLKQYKKMAETKSWFFEKMNKIDNLQPNSSKKKGEGPNQ